MTKVRLISDTHCEGNDFKYKYMGEDILVLAGDIHTRNRHRQLIDTIPLNVEIVFVLGNHESYRSIYDDVVQYFTAWAAQQGNFHFLNNSAIKLHGIDFYGGMMCTDFSLDGESRKPFAEIDAARGIADFHYISKRNADGTTRQWLPSDHTEQYQAFDSGLKHWLRETEGSAKRVVVSHFMPHIMCSNPIFAGSALNPYFIADMSRYMGLVDYWLCGHGHSSANFEVEGTRVMMNPKGYSSENAHGFNPQLMVEI